MKKYFLALIFSFYFFLFPLVPVQFVDAQTVRDITFPVMGASSFIDDFLSSRSGGVTQHLATDIIAEKMTPIVSASDGYISYIVIPEASWGYSIFIRDDQGYTYNYLHMNNDTPGTDDGKGGVENAYAPGLKLGTRVTKSQLIGWVGDSGNAEKVGSHLHFEIKDPDGNIINPYNSLVTAAALSPFKDQIHIGSGPVSQVLSVPAYIFSENLSLGSRGESVSQLQKKLKNLGFYIYPAVTGYFGPVTRSAVIKFQRLNSINAIGVVGPITRAALNEQRKSNLHS